MIQTIIIYLFIIAIMSIGGSLKTTKKILGLSFPLFIALIFYSIIFGVRYGVGTDYFAYLEAYQHATIYGELTDNNEFLFDFLTLILAKNGFHFSIYFGIIA